MQVVVFRVILPGDFVHSVLFGWSLQSLQLSFVLELLHGVYLCCRMICFMPWIYLLLSLYLGGAIFPCYNEFWSGVTCRGASGCTVVMVYLCDGEPDLPVFAVTRLEIVLLFYFALYWFHSLSNGWQFLSIVSLRGY